MVLFGKKKENNSEISQAYRETYVEKVTKITIESEKQAYDSDFIVIDFETANNKLNSACSIGLVAVKGTKIINHEYYLIKPPTDRFDDKNIKIHGITYDDVRNAEQFPSIWDKIKHYFTDNIIVAHNAQFDMSILRNCLDDYNLDSQNFIYIDSQSITYPSINGKCGTSLLDRANYYGISIDNHHNALEDALVAAKISICSMERLNMPSLNWMAIFYDLSAKQFYNLKANKSFRIKLPSYTNVKPSDIICNNTNINIDNPLYEKNCVLTGELKSLDRESAMQKIVDAGGMVKSGVSSKTHYLIVGKQDKTIVGDDGLSSKEEKAYALIEKGIEIKVITEDDFLGLLI